MQTIKAIVNTRVSTAEQLSNNSLNRQLESVMKAAEKLGAEVPADGIWSGSVSSKAGTNVNRKDLNEMLEYCKTHKDVQYAIFDEYDRFMRSIQEGHVFELKFMQLGVKVWFASESESFNGNDAMAKLMRSLKAYEAEGSNEERQRKSIHGHEKAIREGRYTFPPKPGYKKGEIPGVHVPHPITFKLLQAAFKEVLSGLYTPTEALKRLNETEFGKVHANWRMDKFRTYATDGYYAGILKTDKQVKAENQHGLHKPMLTSEEHEQLVQIFTGRTKLRGAKKQYNPEFPMNKVLLCGDCGGDVKFTGSKKNNGYAKKTIKYYFKYHCRGCGKSYHRDEVHQAITDYLHSMTYEGAQQNEFVEALETVWSQKQQDKIQALKQWYERIEKLKDQKDKLVIQFSQADTDLQSDIQDAIARTKADIAVAESKVNEAGDLQEDLIDFIKFALEYTNGLMDDWWQLDHDDRVRCQQLIFPAGITFNSKKKVGTPEISPIYTLKPNKKDLSYTEKSLMVELVGTAPTSAGLSWLVVYRHSPF